MNIVRLPEFKGCKEKLNGITDVEKNPVGCGYVYKIGKLSLFFSVSKTISKVHSTPY